MRAGIGQVTLLDQDVRAGAAVQNILDFFDGSLDPKLVVNAASVSPSAKELLRA